MNTYINLIIIVLTTIISSCVPAPEIYWEPFALGGKLKNTTCGIVITGKDTIKFQRNGISIEITTFSSLIRVRLYIPENNFAKFESENFVLYDENNVVESNIQIPEITYYDFGLKEYKNLNATDKMIGGQKELLSVKHIFEIRLQINKTRKKRYFLKIPSIQTNTGTLNIPIIEFNKKERFGVFPINC